MAPWQVQKQGPRTHVHVRKMHACAALLGLALFSLPTGWHRVKSQLRTKAALMLPKMSVPTQDPEEWSPAHTQGPTSTMTPFVHRKPDKPRSSGTQFGRDPGRAGTRTFPGTKSRNPPECTNMATRGTAPHVPRDGQGVLAPQVRPAPLGRNTLPNTLHFRSSTRHVCPPRGPLSTGLRETLSAITLRCPRTRGPLRHTYPSQRGFSSTRYWHVSTHLINSRAGSLGIPASHTTTRHEVPQPRALGRIRHSPLPHHLARRPPEGLGSHLPTKSTPSPTRRA